ncbi:MAG: mechanosensitive ion channel family protein [Acetobacteraceae bacterium]
MADPIAHAAGAASAALTGWPPALVIVILFAGAVLLAWALQVLLMRVVPRRLLRKALTLDALVERARRPLLFALAIVFLGAVIPVAPLSPPASNFFLHALSAAVVVLAGWSALIAIDVLARRELARHHGNIQNDPTARKHATQWQVLRRSLHVLTILVTLAAALMAFPGVRTYGVSLLASAGAAGLVVGLAARPVLSNLIAGIQIAITQPLRIEDAVVINEQWGWIEEITSTYVVVRIWNWQRMVVPLAWLLEHPFQNWTRESAELIGSVHWHVDYTVPMEVLRHKLEEIVRSTKLWSGKVVVLQVTSALAQTMELRALVSARTSGEAWDLRCYVREHMIAFLQTDYPHALPKQRLEFKPRAAGSTTARNEMTQDGAMAAPA